MIATAFITLALVGQTAAQRIDLMRNPPPAGLLVAEDGHWQSPEVAVIVRDVIDGNTVLAQFPSGKLVIASLIGPNKEPWELEDAEYLEAYIGHRVLVAYDNLSQPMTY